MKPELVRRAAAEFFEEGFQSAETAKIVRDTEPSRRVEAYEKLRFQRTVPDGCFRWIQHLVWLDNMLETVNIALTAEEAEGLLILRRERVRFENRHPPCARCGMPNEAHALRCRECMEEIPH